MKNRLVFARGGGKGEVRGGRCCYTRATRGTLVIMKVLCISTLSISYYNTVLWFCKCYHGWKLDKRHMGSVLFLKLHVNLPLSQNNVQLKKCPHSYRDFNIYVNFPILAHIMKLYKLILLFPNSAPYASVIFIFF